MNDQNELGGDLQDDYLAIQELERNEALAAAPWNQEDDWDDEDDEDDDDDQDPFDDDWRRYNG